MLSFMRFLQRNKLYTFIELFGMILSLAFVILIFVYSTQELTVPKDQKDVNRIYALGSGSYMGMTYSTAEHVCPQIPEIEDYTRIAWTDRDVVVGDSYFATRAAAVDDDFLQFFAFNMLEGDATSVLSSSQNVIISKQFANAAFGGDAIGKPLSVIYGGEKVELIVGGVMDDFKNTIFQPTDIIFSIEHPVLYSEMAIGDPLDHWGSTDIFVKIVEGSDRKVIEDKVLKQYEALWPNYGSFIKGVSMTRMDEIYFSELNSQYRHGNKRMVWNLLMVGFVLLISAVLNYLNLSVAQSGKRAREMAMRRMLGSSKFAILVRYFLESLCFCAISFSVAFLVALSLKGSASSILGVSLSLIPDIKLLLMYIVMLVVIAVVAGGIQYLLVSKIKAIDVVKGEFALRSKNVFTKIFIIIQSSICIVLLTMAFTMQKQMNYLKNRPRGYNYDNMIFIGVHSFNDRNSFNLLLDELRKLPFVKSAGISNGTPGGYSGGQFLTLADGSEMVMRVVKVDSTCFNMYGFKVVSTFEDAIPGSAFYTQEGINAVGGVDAARSMDRLPCCGIIEPFKYGSALYNDPAAYDYRVLSAVQIIPNTLNWMYGIMVLTDGDYSDAVAEIDKMWKEKREEFTSNPAPIEITPFKDMIYGDLEGPRNTLMLIFTFMIVAIIISLMGLFAMCSYFTGQNAKNIAFNRVYGAQIRDVVIQYSKSFLWPILVSIVVAVPVAIYFMDRYLNTNPDRISIPYELLVIAVLISLVFSMMVIVGQMLDAATDDPVKSLKKN